MKRWLSLFPILPLVATGLACGGDPDPGQPVSAERAVEMCADACDHVRECGWDGDAGCDGECREVASVYRGDLMEDLVSCVTDLSCSSDVEVCEAVFDAVQPLPYHDDFIAACTARVNECTFEPGFCTDDVIPLLAEPVITRMQSCIAGPCDTIDACLDGAITARRAIDSPDTWLRWNNLI